MLDEDDDVSRQTYKHMDYHNCYVLCISAKYGLYILEEKYKISCWTFIWDFHILK